MQVGCINLIVSRGLALDRDGGFFNHDRTS
jgi:hypothetical protein